MQILIEISDKEQAEAFLIWVQNRGDILLGDYCSILLGDTDEVAKFLVDGESKSRYVFIGDASEVSNSVEENRNSG